MISRTTLLLIICICAVCALPMQVSSLPMVGFSLKPSPASGPYQDNEFLEKANTTIYGLSNQSIPTGTALRDLQSVQQELSKMSISPKLYPVASDINAFLYYTSKAGDEYSDASSLGGSPYSPVVSDSSIFGDATEYYQAAKKTWEHIKARYPGVTLYTMTQPSSDLGNDDTNIYSYDTPSHGHSGLW